MEKEFDLSDFIESLTTQEKLALGIDVLNEEFCYVKVKKIKEFIQRLKEEFIEMKDITYGSKYIHNKINKLAGGKLM